MSISQDLTLTFNPLLYADEGEYRCTVNITSPYLIMNHTLTNAVNITVSRKFIVWEDILGSVCVLCVKVCHLAK